MSALTGEEHARWRRIVAGGRGYEVRVDAAVLEATGVPIASIAPLPVMKLSWSQSVEGRITGSMTVPAVDHSRQQPLDWRPHAWHAALLPTGNRVRVTMTVDDGQEKQACVLGVALIMKVDVPRAASEIVVTLGDVTEEIGQQKLEYSRPTRAEVGHSHKGWADKLMRSIGTARMFADLPDPGKAVSTTAVVPVDKVYDPGVSYLDLVTEAVRMTHPANYIRTTRAGRVEVRRLPPPGPDRGYVTTIADGVGGTLVDVTGGIGRAGGVNRVTVRVKDSNAEGYPAAQPATRAGQPTPSIPPSSTAPAALAADGDLANSREGLIYRWLVGRGLSPSGACGVMGNLMAESSLDASAVEPPPGTGIGLVQWSHTRATDLRTWMAAKGYAWDDTRGQLEFMEHEITTVGAYAGLWDRLKSASDPVAACKDFANVFEKPGVYGLRDDYAHGFGAKAWSGRYQSTAADAWTQVKLKWLANCAAVAAWARAEVGTGEYGNGLTKYANQMFASRYGTSATEWCGIFVSAALTSCGIPIPPEWKHLGATWPELLEYVPRIWSGLGPYNYGKPVVGAIGALSYQHVVLVVDASNAAQGWIECVGGNESERVALTRYNVSDFKVFAVPNYALGPLEWGSPVVSDPVTGPAPPSVVEPAAPGGAPPDPNDPKFRDSSSLHTVNIDHGVLAAFGGTLGQSNLVVEFTEKDPASGAAKARAVELFEEKAGLPRTLTLSCLPLPWIDAGLDAIRVRYGGKHEVVEVESWSLSLGDGYPVMQVVARGWPARDPKDLPGVLAA